MTPNEEDKTSADLSCVKLVTTNNLLRPSADQGDDEDGARESSWSVSVAILAAAGLLWNL